MVKNYLIAQIHWVVTAVLNISAREFVSARLLIIQILKVSSHLAKIQNSGMVYKVRGGRKQKKLITGDLCFRMSYLKCSNNIMILQVGIKSYNFLFIY